MTLSWTVLGNPPNDVRNEISFGLISEKINCKFGNLFEVLGKHNNTYIDMGKGLYFKSSNPYSSTKHYYPNWVTDDTIWSGSSTGMSGTNEKVGNTTDTYWETTHAHNTLNLTENELAAKLFECREIIKTIVDQNLLPDKQKSEINAYNYGTVDTSLEHDECAICYNDESNSSSEWLKLNNCAHEYHTNCVEKYLKEKSRCPYCQTVIQMSGDKYDSLTSLEDLRDCLQSRILNNVTFTNTIKTLVEIIKTMKYEDFNDVDPPVTVNSDTTCNFTDLYNQYTNKVTQNSEHVLFTKHYERYTAITIINNQLLKYEHSDKDKLINIATQAWNKPLIELFDTDATNNTNINGLFHACISNDLLLYIEHAAKHNINNDDDSFNNIIELGTDDEISTDDIADDIVDKLSTDDESSVDGDIVANLTLRAPASSP